MKTATALWLTFSLALASASFAAPQPSPSPSPKKLDETHTQRAVAPKSATTTEHNAAQTAAHGQNAEAGAGSAGEARQGGANRVVEVKDLNKKTKSLGRVPMPADAKAAGASGSVQVKTQVDETGRVTSAKAVSGDPKLRKPAEAAVRKARFTPTLLSGQPVKVTGVVTVNFTLQ